MWLGGEPVANNGERRDKVHEWLEDNIGSRRQACTYCSTPLHTAHQVEWGDVMFEEEAYVASCPECYYWVFYSLKDAGQRPMGGPATEMLVHISKLQEFLFKLPSGCFDELEKQLIRKPKSPLDATDMEQVVAAVFRHNYAQCDVMHVGRPSDGGVDVLLVTSDDEKWLVQVKSRMSESSSEGVSTIRNLLGVMLLQGALQGIIVSTADHFTYQAYRERGLAREKGYQISLLDRGKLTRLLQPMIQGRPWLRLVASECPQWYRYFASVIPDNDQLKLF